MLNLILAVCSSALVSLTMRFSETKIRNTVAMLAVNYMLCSLLAWGYAGFGPWYPAVLGMNRACQMGLVNGMLYLAGFILLQKNIHSNGVVLSSTFLKLGLLVSMVVSVAFFGERPGMGQWLGFVLAVAAIIGINYRPGGQSAGSKWGLVVLLLAGGGGDAMSKVFEELGNPVLADHFLLYTFLTAFGLCAILFAMGGAKAGVREVLFGALIGIPNFFSAKFMLAALETVPGVIVYPVCSVGTILVVTTAGVLLFKERLEKRQWVALGMILVALVLLNV